MFLDNISNVISFSVLGTSHRSYAASSMVMASVSTFQDHNATPAARVAARRCFSCHTGIVTSSCDIGFIPPHPTRGALCQAVARQSCRHEPHYLGYCRLLQPPPHN